MAKALLGHMGGIDLRMVAQVRQLQQQVHELEAQVAALRAENEALAAAIDHADLLALGEADHRPVLAGTTR